MKCIRWLDENLEKVFCVAVLFTFTTLMAANVIARFGFQKGFAWGSEATLFLAIWFITISMSYGFKHRAHARVTFVVNLLPPLVQKVLELVCGILMLALYVWLTRGGLLLLTDLSVFNKRGQLIPYPMWTLYLSMPVGCALSVIRLTQNLVTDVKALRKKEE
jgi:C4-dicarboxylate transporter DctQ subunit